MGMYDDVKVARNYLPPAVKEINRFQTKDFECTLATYEITSEGRLHRNGFEYEAHGEPFHGLFTFYAANSGFWYKLKAKFANGTLEYVELIEAPAPDRKPIL